MSKSDKQEVCRSGGIKFTVCSLTDTVIRFNLVVLEKWTRYLTFKPSFELGFSFQSSNLAKGAGNDLRQAPVSSQKSRSQSTISKS